jgi:hypothetical protein
MTTAVTFNFPNPFKEEPENQDDAYTASILASLFNSLAGTWIHERRIENITSVNLASIGHGFCHFASREATKIKGQEDSTEDVEEMIVHETGEFHVEGAGQTSFYIPPIMLNRNFVWRMDKKGSRPAVARPQVEKRKASSAGRKGSIFRRKSSQKSTSPTFEESATRRMSTPTEKKDAQKTDYDASIWRRMSVPAIRRKSKAPPREVEEPVADDDNGEEEDTATNEEEKSSGTTDSTVPQIDVYSTKPSTNVMSFHVHTIKFDLQPETWRGNAMSGEDITISARGDHFSGEERFGTDYQFLLKWRPPLAGIDSVGQYCVENWSTVEIGRGTGEKDKTTTTKYIKNRGQKPPGTPIRSTGGHRP